jgi:hypothetical protein
MQERPQQAHQLMGPLPAPLHSQQREQRQPPYSLAFEQALALC